MFPSGVLGPVCLTSLRNSGPRILMITSWRPLRRIFLRVFEQEGIPAAPAAEILRCQPPPATVHRRLPPSSPSMLSAYVCGRKRECGTQMHPQMERGTVRRWPPRRAGADLHPMCAARQIIIMAYHVGPPQGTAFGIAAFHLPFNRRLRRPVRWVAADFAPVI